MAWRIAYVRLRFILVLAVAFAVVGNWDTLQTHWQKLTKRAAGDRPADQAEGPEIEYWCPMCPGVVKDWPSKCPVCNMALVRRQRGEMVPSPEVGLTRMQLSPYRLQLAGIQTAAAEYRPLTYEVVAGGFLESQPPGKRPQPAGAESTGAADRTRLWLQADVYEKDLALLAPGQRVDVSSDGFPGRTPFAGQLRNVVSQSTHGARSNRVQVEIDNQRSELRVGLFVTARIKVPAARLEWLTRAVSDDWRDRTSVDLAARALAAPPGSLAPAGVEPLLMAAGQQALLQRGLVLTVPDSSVIDTGSKRVVYVETGPGMFEAVEVVVGPRSGDLRPVLHGLEAGQRVAAAGAFLLDAETRLNPAAAAAYFGAARTSVLAPPPARPTDAIAQALAKLSPADRALATRQKLCPVTGEPLGSMGAPFRVEVAGKIVFLCCQGCESELREDPRKYLPPLPGK